MSETRIEYTGNIQVHHPIKPEAEESQICAYCRKPIELRRGQWVHIWTSTNHCDPVFTHQNFFSKKALPLSVKPRKAA